MGGQAGSQPARTATISGGQDENEERRYFTDLLTEFTERLLLLLLPWNVRGKFGCKFGNTGARVLLSLAWWRGWGEGDVHVERSKSFCMSVVASWRWLGSAPFWCTLSAPLLVWVCARRVVRFVCTAPLLCVLVAILIYAANHSRGWRGVNCWTWSSSLPRRCLSSFYEAQRDLYITAGKLLRYLLYCFLG